MKQKAVFFVRAYNDIDHTTPVMYKLVTTTSVQVVIILKSSKNYLKDYRLKFLNKQNGVTIYHINEFNYLKGFKVEALNAKYLLEIIFLKILSYFSESKKREYQINFIENLFNKLFGDSGKGIVAIDWTARSEDKVSFANHVISAAKKRGIAQICLPHGDSPDYNRMFKIETINYESIDHWGKNPFDIVVVPNNLTARRYIHHKGKEKVKIPGSPRYNDEWLNILTRIVPKYENDDTKGFLKIVFFLRNPNYPVFWEEVIRTIKLITQFPEVYLIVKHHTRSGKVEELIKNHPELRKGNVVNLEFVYEDIHSSSLIEWSDVVLDLGTSIVFEAIKKGKPLLAMDYLQANVSTSGHYLKSTVMNCRDDLFDEIIELIKDPKHRLYSEDERQNFIKEMIDYPDGNVLDRYVELIEELIQEASADNNNTLYKEIN